jgi:hypothetical protein
MEKHWFNPQGYWRDGDPVWKEPHYVQPLDVLFREGLIKALELAVYDPATCEKGKTFPETCEKRKDFLPIDCYWICAAHHHFEIDICVSKQQVTFILLSPNVPDEGRHDKADRCLTHKEPIWVLRRMSPDDAKAALKNSQNAVTRAEAIGDKEEGQIVDKEEGQIVVEQLRNFPANLRRGFLLPSDVSAPDA